MRVPANYEIEKKRFTAAKKKIDMIHVIFKIEQQVRRAYGTWYIAVLPHTYEYIALSFYQPYY